MSSDDDPRGTPRDTAARAITVAATVGVAVTVVVAMAISLQEATDPTRSASVPWAGVVALVAAVAGLALLVASRRR